MKLRVGIISYANLFPIFYMLQKNSDCSDYEFIEGVPSVLNKKIRNGRIDVSPSSSIEYLRNADAYDLIEDHSISSKGPVGSILLFSRRPLEALGGHMVLTSSQSETSVALLQIIFRKFYGMECRLKTASGPMGDVIKTNEAYMLIGDEALTEALKWPELFIYDLGDLWYKNTGLPFTFALWIVKKGCCLRKAEVLDRFKRDLSRAKVSALKNLKAVAAASALRPLLSEEELVAYWKGVSYDFGKDHKRGLDLFSKYSKELGLI